MSTMSRIKKWHQNLEGFGARKAQASIEFAFAMIIVLLIVYGLIMVFRWVGVTYAERRFKQEKSLSLPATEEEQLENMSNAGYKPRHLDAVYQGNMYGN